MPINHIGTDLLPLVYDDDYEVNDEDKLAEYIGDIILGYYYKVKDVIDELDSSTGISTDDAIDAAIRKLNDALPNHLKGYIFQHMSWVALASQYHDERLKMMKPHDAPAQHGIDGLALLLDENENVERIIITEDKCTVDPRSKIRSQVYPEFDDFEKSTYDNKIISGIAEIIGTRELRNKIEPDIFKKELWQYRIGINRTQLDEEGTKRRKLFKDYDSHVANPETRRHAATIFIPDTEIWAENMKSKIIKYLESKKTNKQ